MLVSASRCDPMNPASVFLSSVHKTNYDTSKVKLHTHDWLVVGSGKLIVKTLYTFVLLIRVRMTHFIFELISSAKYSSSFSFAEFIGLYPLIRWEGKKKKYRGLEREAWTPGVTGFLLPWQPCDCEHDSENDFFICFLSQAEGNYV